ncbi:hypothetical protein Tsubulata_035092 [Turnera subulata]|uniref:J domain-containing protein n=1 Tax=Turnera subulata TaxID=218843 RepID=A0A9Q0FG42_9ROSI|nr:hypothetical protein Tsubulata_035092 [Turnera subulata]
MGVDYYNVLKLNRNATEEDMKKSFKKLAMRWHPDKNPTNKAQAEAMFKQINQAYDVLSDPRRRMIYDVYGEDGLLNYDFPSSDDDPLHDQRRSSTPTPKRNHKPKPKPKLKPDPVENRLACTLEELYNGTKRKLKISRLVFDDFGRRNSVDEILKIDIQRGWKNGTKVTFPDKGNEEPGFAAPDLVFVVDEKPHPVFKRDGNDLLVNRKISLVEALTGTTVEITALDGRVITIPVKDILRPGCEVVIPGEGMPISREPGVKGKLRIKFDVEFPSRLSVEQKANLKRVLTGADFLV